MKTNVQLILAGMMTWMLSSTALNAQLSFTTTSAVTVDFTNTVMGINNGAFLGLGLASSPTPGQLDSDGVTITGLSNTMGGSIPSDFFIPSPSDALFAVIDGSDNWLAVSPTGDWSIVLQIDNDIPGTSIYSLDISFSINFRNLDEDDQVYTLEYATNPGGPWTQFGNTLTIPSFVPENVFWLNFTFDAGILCFGELTSGSSMFLRISGSGSATDNIAFDEVTFTPVTTSFCSLTNITSFATANVEDVTLDLNWMEDGSGDCAETFFVVGREGVAPAADLLVSNLQGLYEAGDFNASSNWATRSDLNEVFTQTFFTLGADEVDYFVYKGSGNSVTISGLEQNTNYNFLIMATGEKCAWTVGSNINTTTLLPIELLSFTATAKEEEVVLNWRTQTEINNDYMAVERSEDGVDFYEIGRVLGAGNTQVPQEYSFRDQAPIWGTNYYRLKQVDFDGTPTYYRIISVEYDAHLISWQVSPTLATDQLMIHTNKAFEAGSSLQILNLSGQVLKTLNAETEAFRQSLDVSSLPSGPYFIRLNRQGRVTVKRFVKR